MLIERPFVKFSRAGAVVCGLALASAAAVSELPAQVCPCVQRSPFGSCLTDRGNLGQVPGYPGSFPGSAFALAAAGEAPPRLFVIDFYGGTTSRYNRDPLDPGAHFEAPVVFPSPRGASSTTGAAVVLNDAVPSNLWIPENEDDDPTNNVLPPVRQNHIYWLVGNKLVVTLVPADSSSSFTDVLVKDIQTGAPRRLEYTIDVGDIALRLFGSRARAGQLGQLAYHAGRQKLWVVDIVNDVFVEINKNGSLSLDAEDRPIHFFNPALNELNSKAYGNAITYAQTADGEYFDILVGSLSDLRPVRVMRLLAPTVPGPSTPIGADSGLGYPIFPQLLTEVVRGSMFPTGMLYWKDSCGQGQGSAYICVYDTTGAGTTILEVAEDPPAVSNVADLACEAVYEGGANAVRITWRNTGRYESLQIIRTSITDPSRPPATVLNRDVSTEGDPEEVLDAGLPIPADGTYQYRAVARSVTASETAPDVTCTVTVGRGSLLASQAVTAASGSALVPEPYAVARTPEHLYVVDADSGIANRYNPQTLEPIDSFQGPFSADETTTGLTYDSVQDRLIWLGRINQQNFLLSTDLGGGNASPLLPVQYPPDLLRSPIYGDISFDARREQIWIVNLYHDVVFAITRGGLYVEGTKLLPGALGDSFAGGVSVVEGTAAEVVLDTTFKSVDYPYRVSMTRFRQGLVEAACDNGVDDDGDGLLDCDDPDCAGRPACGGAANAPPLPAPEIVFSIDLSGVTQSSDVGGIEAATISSGGETIDVEYAVAADTSRVYILTLEEAEVGSLPFRRGDANNDGRANISDASFILSWLFKGGAQPPCADAADIDDSGTIELTDALWIFNYLFRDGEPPAAPWPDCGFDATPSPLECEESICTEQP